jgi:hypothetical protein
MTRYLLLFDCYGLVFVGRPLWRVDGSVFCISCWSSPAQFSSGPSPLDLATISYCLSFETSHFVASYDSQGHGGGIRPHLHTGVVWCQSQSYVMTDGSVGRSVLEYSTRLGLTTRSLILSDSCMLVYVGRSLWREDGSVLCQTQSAAIRLLSICTIYMLQVIKCMYIQHSIQGLCQFRLSTADHALSLVAPSTTAG